jgi:acid phosphatase type 7
MNRPLAYLLLASVMSGACTGSSPSNPDDTSPEAGLDSGDAKPGDGDGDDVPPGQPHLVIAAGDIASSESGDTATAKLVDTLEGTIILLGDNAYSNGSTSNYMDYYEPTWGKFKARTRPAPGNHEYRTSGASGYFSYFGDAAGERGKGYYSFDLGNWHLIALNSNGEEACEDIACDAGSDQEKWLRADLAASTKPCTLAYWHHPRFSSGDHRNSNGVQALWEALADANAELVLNGHDHNYERFKPLNPAGQIDTARGIVEIVVGTGGKDLRPFPVDKPAISEIRDSNTFGVLQLKLYDDRAEFEFKPVAGKTFTDSGTIHCH